MGAVEVALEPLEAEERKRVISWAAQKYGVVEAKSVADGEHTDRPERSASRRRRARTSATVQHDEGPGAPIKDIVNAIRTSERAELIEKNVLDRQDQLNRVLLPLFIVHTTLNDHCALSARDIAEVLRLLSVPVARENVSKMLREPGARFVTIESEGSPKRFKLIKRGAVHMESLLSARHPADAEKAAKQPDGSRDSKPGFDEFKLMA
jgi:hypothetical protein